MKQVQLNSKNVYGEVKHYPACELSRLIADCAGKKTITDSMVRMIEDAGYTVTKQAVV